MNQQVVSDPQAYLSARLFNEKSLKKKIWLELKKISCTTLVAISDENSISISVMLIRIRITGDLQDPDPEGKK